MSGSTSLTPMPAPAPIIPSTRQDDAELSNPLRRVAFFAGIVLIFMRFSMFAELLSVLFGTNAYLLYIFGPPAVLGVLLTGGLKRSLRLTPARYWLGFLIFVLLAVPFSSWRGGSTVTALGFARLQLPMLFVAAGLALTWKECRIILYSIALAGVVSVIVGRAFALSDNEGRYSMEFGTMANANDFAAHLLIVLPFLVFIMIAPGKVFLFRLISLGLIGYGLYLILRTGSRGALVALVAGFLLAFWRATAKARLGLVVAVPVLLLVMAALLPQTVFQRLQTFSSDRKQAEEVAAEAAESARARLYVFGKSIEYTIRHPIFGVGPGQFSSFEGQESKAAGLRGAWHETHSIFTQVSAECGIPAFFFYTAALLSTFLLLLRIQKEASRYPELREIAIAAFCVSLALVCFVGAAAFLNLAYIFHLPALSGVAIAIHIALRREVAALTAAQPATALAASGFTKTAVAPFPSAPSPQPVRRPYRGSKWATPGLTRPKSPAQPPRGVSALDA